MSRGPGKLQSTILDAVEAKGSISFGQLCWHLAEEDGHRISDEGELSQTFYTSCHRAVNRLVDEGRLPRNRRKLRSIAELAMHYPYKTRRKTMRDLRLRLLPHLKDYLDETQKRQFGSAEVERFFLSQQSAAVMREVGQRWQSLEELLCKLLGEVPSERREVVLDLIVKGRASLLDSNGATHPSDLGSLIKRALFASGQSEAEHSVYTKIKELYATCFPLDKRRLMNLKDQLYVVADLSQRGNGKPYLKENFKQELLRRDGLYLEVLPGHRIETAIPIPGYSIDFPPSIYYSPILDQLIGRDSLAAFDFLSRK